MIPPKTTCDGRLKPLRLLKQIVCFGCVGMLSALLHFCVVIFLVHFFYYRPLYANVLAFLVAFWVSFLGHRYWTFYGSSQSFFSILPRFFFIALISFVFNETFYWYLLTYWHGYYPVALVLVLVSVSMLTFVLSKFWAFSLG